VAVSEKSHPASAATVLVIDDDADLREALCEALNDAGYTTLQAGDGREALACLRAAPLPQIIILDLMMPIMNGWEFRDEQRRDPVLAAIPVVVMTASRDFDRPALAAADYLQKPVTLDVLFEVLRNRLAAST
jgi:CheY-like chemotaxis protein